MSVQPPSHDKHYSYPQNELSKKQMLEEVQIQAVMLFLSNWSAEEAPAGDTSTKDGKIQQVVKELQEGHISVAQAASEILSILQEHKTLSMPKVPEKRLDQPETQLLLNVQLFAHYLHENPSVDQRYLDKAVELANGFYNHKMTMQEGAKKFSSLVEEVNSAHPGIQPYPSFSPTLFLS